jgi:transposase-like protein
MKAKRRKFTAGFKAQVAIEALKERDTLAELSKRYEVHVNMISKWKQEFVDRSSEIFQTNPPEMDFEVEREKLYAKIGQLEMERDWLKKISKMAVR